MARQLYKGPMPSGVTAPSLGLTKFLADWYVWATGTQKPVDGGGYWLDTGLCANLRWCFTGELDADAINELCKEMQDMFEAEFGTREYPFGEDAYNSISDNAHQDPNRLAWVERKLAERDIVAAPKWYRDFRIRFEYGSYWATHDDCEQEPDGEGGWQIHGMRTGSRTLAGLREEIDALLEEAE